MNIVFYSTGNGNYEERDIIVFRQTRHEFALITKFKLKYKYIASLIVREHCIFVVLSVPDVIHKYTIGRSKIFKHHTLDIGTAFASHCWKRNLYIGNIKGEISIINCLRFQEESRHKLLKDTQICHINNNGTTFAACFHSGISIFKHERDTIINITFIDTSSMNIRNVNYSKILNNGTCIFSIRKQNCSDICILNGDNPEIIKTIDTNVGRIIVSDGNEVAISSKCGTYIEFYKEDDLHNPTNKLNVPHGSIIWMSYFNSKYLYYSTIHQKSYNYYYLDRIYDITILITILEFGTNAKMAI